MNRRGFLQLLGIGAAGFALDPERLLWRPGAKTIFLPSVVPSGTSITFNTNALRVGDIFTIEGVYAVNPPSRSQMFQITSVTSSGVYNVKPLANLGQKMRSATRGTNGSAS